MTTYLLLLRGINVGGKNKVPMTELKAYLEQEGLKNVVTYIQSGNVIVSSDSDAETVASKVEDLLLRRFKLDSPVIKVHTITKSQLERVVRDRPKGFGDQPDIYYSDVIFLIGIEPAEAMQVFSPREGVDKIWAGEGVIYSQRLGVERTKSRLSKIMSSPFYKFMTIRNWNTTTKLLKMLEEAEK